MIGRRRAVLYVIDNIEFGGGERGFLQLAVALRDRYAVAFACHPGGVLGERLGPLGVPLHAVDFRRLASVPRVLRLARLMRAGGVDLVHSMGARADFAARVAGRLAGVPVVVSTVAMLVEGYEARPWRRAVYRAALGATARWCHGFIAESDALRRRLVDGHGIAAGRVTRIYRGVELDLYRARRAERAALRRALGLDPGRPVVGTVGRLVYQKAQEVFLRAAARVAGAVAGTQVLVVGDGPRRAPLERLARDLGLDVRFTGFRTDVPDLLGALDVFVLSSVLEGFPQVLLEAMAAGTPLVATRIDGVTEVVETERTGLLVPPRDPEALAGAVVALLRDPALAGRLAAEARRRMEERFGVARMVADVSAFYEGLLAAAGGARRP